jgi:hypothetical protein
MATVKRKKPSGPSGKHTQRSTLLREGRPGQFDEWREVAVADGRTLSGWLRFTLDNAVEKWRKSKK